MTSTLQAFRLSIAAPALLACTVAPALGANSAGCGAVAETADCTIAWLQGAAAATPPSTDALYVAERTLKASADRGQSRDDVDAMKRLIAELDARHATRPADRRRLMDVLLLNGLADEANAYKANIPSQRDDVFPHLEPLARPARAGEPSFWRWDAQADVLREHSLDLAHGSYVVVSAGLGCHFCNDAARAIPADPTLATAFREHAIWISKPDATADQAAFTTWARAHPATPIDVVYDLKGWPGEIPWSTPIFYFMRDGQVVKVVKGWTTTHAADLRDGLKAIGLAPIG